jgi:hypothetical protein
MVRDVPFDAARDPGPDQTDQRRFDHVLPVNEVVAVALIDGLKQAPADLRQDPDANIFIFQVNDAIELVRFDIGERVVERVRVNTAFRSLRALTEEEHRVRLGVSGQIGWDRHLLLGESDRVGPSNAGGGAPDCGSRQK